MVGNYHLYEGIFRFPRQEMYENTKIFRRKNRLGEAMVVVAGGCLLKLLLQR